MSSKPRFLQAVRNEIEMMTYCLDDTLDCDHQARVVWEFVEQLDLSAFYEKIRAFNDRAGRPAIDPKILMALWIYATLRGIGSAREIQRLCSEHSAYRWICGGVGINRHTLSDFHSCHDEELDTILTKSVASLMAAGLVSLDCVAQDGIRVRASAGEGSFRSKSKLEQCLAQAEQQVKALRESSDGGQKRKIHKAQERVAKIKEALENIEEIEASTKKNRRGKHKDKPIGASASDPLARVMGMADGGFRPAHNIQYVCDAHTSIVVGVDVGERGSDKGELGRMLERLEENYAAVPKQYLADGNFLNFGDIEKAASKQCLVYVSPKRRNNKSDVCQPTADDSPAVADWRTRMKSQPGKAIYHIRAKTIEWVNAQARNKGLQQLATRGRRKAKASALWFAFAINLMRVQKLKGAES